MAQNNPLPNFDNIATATATLNTELPRIGNLQGAQLNQAILDRLDTIQDRLDTFQDRLDSIHAELRGNSNDFIRLQNSQRLTLNPRTTLLPLKSLRTRASIANCPNTVAQIRQLARAEARHILRELRQHVPDRDRAPALREAVRKQFFLDL